MWQKIKCWLGRHEWKDMCCDGYCDFAEGVIRGDCYNCPYGHEQNIVCKHCGKIKMIENIKKKQNKTCCVRNCCFRKGYNKNDE